MTAKTEVFDFLTALQNELRNQLPLPTEMRALISRLGEEGKMPSAIRENIFIYHVLPKIWKHLQTIPGIGANDATTSVLCEYHRKVPEFASGNPFRRLGHPFGKKFGLSIAEVVNNWTNSSRTLPINQAYPDFCLRSPFPFKIAFDAKYFVQNSRSAADKALVEGAYEAMYYRGLPVAVAKSAEEPGWEYDYGCLLAYDASEDGLLEASWQSVRCKSAFWDGANIFVMIIRGTTSGAVRQST